MPKISAFRGLRYDLGQIGSLESTLAPSATALDDHLRDELYKRHPANVVRLIANRPEPSDQAGERFSRSGRLLRNWQRQGLIQHEPDPAIYVYHQSFECPIADGKISTRRGFFCSVEMESNFEKIKPIEMGAGSWLDYSSSNDMSLLAATKANFEPALGLYSGDGCSQVQTLLDEAVRTIAPIEALDEGGGKHQIWPVTDIRIINQVTSLISNATIHIAHGAHSYAASLAYRNKLGETASPFHGVNRTLMCLVEADQLSLQLDPVHRVIRGRQVADFLPQLIAKHFVIADEVPGLESAELVWQRIQAVQSGLDYVPTFGVYAVQNEKWLIIQATESAALTVAEAHPSSSEVWRSLDSAIFNRLLLDESTPTEGTLSHECFASIQDLIARLNESDGDWLMAAVLNPPSQEQLGLICEGGEQLPQHCVSIVPPIPSGLVFYPHDA